MKRKQKLGLETRQQIIIGAEEILIGGKLEIMAAYIMVNADAFPYQAQIKMDIKISCTINEIFIEPYSFKSSHSLTQSDIARLIDQNILILPLNI